MTDTKAKTGERPPTSIVTGTARASYPNVFAPKAVKPGQKEKYSISLVFLKSDKVTFAAAKKAILAAYEAEKNGKLKGKTLEILQQTGKLPLKDGDVMKPNDPVYAGCYYINCTSPSRPKLLNQRKEQITSEDEFYAGVYCRASINFYAYNVDGGIGISAGLNNIQKVKDGEKISSRPTAEQEFDEIEVDLSDDDFSMD
jgi:hypothetical protein